MPQISVVIPAYNASLYLPECLDSILNQSFEDFEVIVIDDASKDNTWEVIEEYAAKDTRIRPFQNKENLGIAGNRNKGVQLATAKYICWQDADDISLPNRLKNQFEFLEEHPEVGIVGGFLELFCGSKTLGIRKYATSDRELRGTIFKFSPVAQPAAMLRRAALEKVGAYNLKYPPAEDLDMTFRIGEHYKLANIPEVVIRYRESASQATHRQLKKMELSTLEIRRIFSRSTHYQFTGADLLYNLAHWISVWIVPANTKIWLFKLLRNTKSA